MGIRLSWMGIGLLAAGSILLRPVGSPASSTYLSKTGPSPLRFQKTAPHILQAVLPPLQMSDAAPVADANPARPMDYHKGAEGAGTGLAGKLAPVYDVPAPFQVDGSPTTNADGLTGPITVFPPVTGLFPPDSTNALPLLTPQMLLSFFRPGLVGTNGAVGIVIPVEFSPPSPVSPPASRATYTVR